MNLIIKSRRGGYDGRKGITMTMTTFIIIIGLVLLTTSAISDAIALLKWLYEHDRRKRSNERK